MKTRARKKSRKAQRRSPKRKPARRKASRRFQLDELRGLFPAGVASVTVSGDTLTIHGAATVAGLPDDLRVGQHVPAQSEVSTVGAATTKIVRNTPAFAELTRNMNGEIVFKDEEHTSADRMMTSRLAAGLNSLAALVRGEWPGSKLRVTEAWDENNEHGTRSLHYEARAADLTTSPVDGAKLGRLARLAVNAGLDWVLFEDERHVHVSVR